MVLGFKAYKAYRAALAVALFAGAAGGAHADIVIGVAGPMSGQYASGGEQMRAGVGQVVADINAAGGLLGQQLRMDVGDDVCDPRQAVAVANAYANKKVNAVVGHYCSSSTIPASEVYAEENIPMITISTNGRVTDRGLENVFRISWRDDDEGAAAARYIAAKFPGKKVAVVDDRAAYGKEQADVVAATLAKLGQAPVLRTAITAGERDYTALVSRLKAGGIDVMFYGGYFTELGLILRQAQQAGLNVQFVSGNTSNNSDLIAAAGSGLDGLLFTFFPDPREREAAAGVIARIKAGGVDPDGWALFSYAAAQAYVQAVKLAGSTEPAKVQQALRAGKFQTVIGDDVQFDAKGDRKNPTMAMYRWQGGQYAVLDLVQ